jgi:N-acetylmuramoyl-L-alanine amidase
MKSTRSCVEGTTMSHRTRGFRRIAVLSMASAIAAAAVSAQTTPLATIKDIRRSVLPDAVRITIELDREVPFHSERIPDPMRVFVDFSGTRPATPLADRTLRFDTDADTDIVRQIRIGRHPNNVTRVVLDGLDVSSYSVYPLYSPFRIVIDCVRGSGPRQPNGPLERPAVAIERAPIERAAVERAAAPPPILEGRRITPRWVRRMPTANQLDARVLADIRARTAEMATAAAAAPAAATTAAQASAPASRRSRTTSKEPAPAIAEPVSTADPTPAPEPPPRNVGGGFSISRQLGLAVSRIVIDAGHGGHDPGAKGKGINEAELVLDVALRLEALLQQVPGVEVVLTRRTDEFIALQERTAIANREGADLFLSIHANANSNVSAHGIETYFLNFTNNLSAAAVAARENAASGQPMNALPDIVKSIALNNKLAESRDFAGHIQRAMVEKLRTSNKGLKDLGVKQAPFVVLIGAAMPSVLAEISFVTNPQEARLLKNNPYRQRIAEALFNAIRRYQTSLKNGTAVASQ